MLNACFQTTFDLKFRCFVKLHPQITQTTLIYLNVSTVWQHLDCLTLQHGGSVRLFSDDPLDFAS